MRQLLALVIDDDKNLAQGFAIALQYCGFEVQHISDATQALTTIQMLKPDVLTLDIHMPNVSGIDILRAIRQTPTLSHTSVIIATGSSSMAQDPVINDMADAILLKPIDLAKFTAFARRFAERRRTQEMLAASVTPPPPPEAKTAPPPPEATDQ
jgi:DNA-binding response OmpR family regulator